MPLLDQRCCAPSGRVGVRGEVWVVGGLRYTQPQRLAHDFGVQPTSWIDDVAIQLARLQSATEHLYPGPAVHLHRRHTSAAPYHRRRQRDPLPQRARGQNRDIKEAIIRLCVGQ
jgi:hypothetical protein